MTSDQELQTRILLKLQEIYPGFTGLGGLKELGDEERLIENLVYLKDKGYVTFQGRPSHMQESHSGKDLNIGVIKLSSSGIEFLKSLG